MNEDCVLEKRPSEETLEAMRELEAGLGEVYAMPEEFFATIPSIPDEFLMEVRDDGEIGV